MKQRRNGKLSRELLCQFRLCACVKYMFTGVWRDSNHPGYFGKSFTRRWRHSDIACPAVTRKERAGRSETWQHALEPQGRIAQACDAKGRHVAGI